MNYGIPQPCSDQTAMRRYLEALIEITTSHVGSEGLCRAIPGAENISENRYNESLVIAAWLFATHGERTLLYSSGECILNPL